MKLILGAAQLGLDYGITNHAGMPAEGSVNRLLDLAANSGITYIDSAEAYGESNQRIGNYHRTGKHRFKVINKILRYEHSNHAEYKEMIDQERQLLDIKQFDTLMAHDPSLLLEDTNLQFLLELKACGMAHRIGVSIQSPIEIERLLARFTPDVVQLPINLFDQRAITQNTLTLLKSKKIEVHARSVFLQGILLTPKKSLPEYFKRYDSLFTAYDNLCAHHNITKLEAALSFVLNQAEIDYVVVGCQTPAELRQILKVAESTQTPPSTLSNLASTDETLIHPSSW